MSTKLFPPMIDSKLPAFAGSEITIPFVMNRAVSLSQVKQMSLIIKTSQTGTIIADGLLGSYSYNEQTKDYTASFQLGDLYSTILTARKVCPGQYYKVQIAYVNATGVTGFYSSVGIIKCTTTPVLKILSLNENYYGNGSYTGQYSQDGENKDSSEKVYSYQFYLRDGYNNVLATSGEQIHDYSNDTNTTTSQDIWNLTYELEEGISYYLSYKITTINGYSTESEQYVIEQSESVDPNLPCKLIAISDFDDGCVQLYIRPITNKPLNGSFVLSRASSEDNYGTWHKIYSFSYKNVVYEPRDVSSSPSNWDINDVLIWEDFTTLQGVSYKYAIQAYNSLGLYSSRVLNVTEYLDESYTYNPDLAGIYHTIFRHSPVYADFEDAFLTDGERQLKLRFNPKVSSFKSNRLEAKLDTIGGKYPFIFRNGRADYKEFPISGLLSLVSDPNERFMSGIQKHLFVRRNEAGLIKGNLDADTQLTADNLRREREFKMEALAWLTNGQPKVFRSPSEGNYIVRLMNTSMTPNDTLGRMLHTFTSTAYEIAEYNFDNLDFYNFIKKPYGDNRFLKVGQLQMHQLPNDTFPANSDGQIMLPDAYFVNITDATPGTIFGLDFADGTGINYIEIGSTGSYYVPFTNEKCLKRISLVYGEYNEAKLTYCYYDNRPTDNFSIIINVEGHDEIRQYIGNGYPDTEEQRQSLNIINDLTDVRRQVGNFHFIRATQRPVWVCYQQDTDVYSRDPKGLDILSGPDWNDTIIYEVRHKTSNAVLRYLYGSKKIIGNKPDYRFSVNGTGIIDMGGNPNGTDTYVCRDCNYQGGSASFGGGGEVMTCPYCHSNDVHLIPTTHGRIESLTNLDYVDTLYAGSGVILDIGYRVKEILYSVEDEDPVAGAKQSWTNAKQAWQQAVADGSSNDIIQTYRQLEREQYALYIATLEQVLAEQGVV